MNNLFFISGASGGLGKAFAVECARRGWDLYLTDLEEKPLIILADGLKKSFGVKVTVNTCDLTDQLDREKLFADIVKQEIEFSGLVNIAGLEYEGLFLNNTRDQIRTIVRLNIESVLDLTHFMLKRKNPGTKFRIITVSSLAAFFPIPAKATYSASKGFLLNFFLALREELKPAGVTVTVLCPAGLPTKERVISSIGKQGLIGRITAKNIGDVAYKTIGHALKGKPVYIPGFLNRLLRFTGTMLPPVNLAYLLGKRWLSAK